MEKFLNHLVGILDTEMDIKMETQLNEIEEWDSLSIVSFAAMVDIQYNKKVTVSQIKQAKTVYNLAQLVFE
ncbi:phosphopantetheine-binding protein [Propionispora vibrioides]|uniref:Phosphopantetheine attachment site n=1 Tax=Propionispora vibrioides TaxID=112903 RepID=A0A1H8RW76_9FIRM|nr:phosphopantetheine-binding protein [Propionispora vibrioides]SEO70612.1 Phosphopantetheine attachment site [Propionispora vibrioides]